MIETLVVSNIVSSKKPRANPPRDALLRCEISPLTRKAIRNPN